MGWKRVTACLCVCVCMCNVEIVVTLKMHTMKRQDGVVVKQLAVLGLAPNVPPPNCIALYCAAAALRTMFFHWFAMFPSL